MGINYTQKCFPLRKLTETKDESLVAALSSLGNQKKQVGFRFYNAFVQTRSDTCFLRKKNPKTNQISVSSYGCRFYWLEHIFERV